MRMLASKGSELYSQTDVLICLLLLFITQYCIVRRLFGYATTRTDGGLGMLVLDYLDVVFKPRRVETWSFGYASPRLPF